MLKHHRKKELKKYGMKRLRMWRAFAKRLLNYGAYGFQRPKWFPYKGDWLPNEHPGEE